VRILKLSTQDTKKSSLFEKALLHHFEGRIMGVGSSKLLFENLDLTPIHSILWTKLHQYGPGRPVEYNPKWGLRALMLRQREQIPYMKDLVKRLRLNLYLRQVCSYGDRTRGGASMCAVYDMLIINAHFLLSKT